jgi:hypothetical protein
VEVSGWDQDNIYFVEKSTLDWDEFADKHIAPRRRHDFRPNAPAAAMRQAQPVPYHVEFIGCDTSGMHQFRPNARISTFSLSFGDTRSPTQDRLALIFAD